MHCFLLISSNFKFGKAQGRCGDGIPAVGAAEAVVRANNYSPLQQLERGGDFPL
jgi:hypothetical protein